MCFRYLHSTSKRSIDSTDIGMSDHFLVWLELGRTAKNSRKQLDGGVLISLVMMLLELQAEVEVFSDGISQMEKGGMRGIELVKGVEWESIVNRDTVGEKVIVCGRSVRWWDDEIKAKIEQRRQLYGKKLRREVKHLVMEKKNGVVEKANAYFEANNNNNNLNGSHSIRAIDHAPR